MKSSFIFLICFIFSLEAIPSQEKPKTICLNMIVKDESPVIRRCLASVKKIIDYWVIVDTGSTDGTQEIIREFMRDIPGELHERPWVDFAHNRNEALALAKNKGDYLLFMDADQELIFFDTFVKADLDKDAYLAPVQDEFAACKNYILVNSHLDWKWEGVLHECLINSKVLSLEELKGALILATAKDGRRAQDPKKSDKDAELLEKALEKDPTNCRHVFYLANSYARAKKYTLAIKNYEKRASMGEDAQEVFWSLYMIGCLQGLLEMPYEKIFNSYCTAYQVRPSRAEPLFCLAIDSFKRGDYILGYSIAKMGLSIPFSEDTSFVARSIYEYDLLCVFSQCAYKLGKYAEAEDALRQVVSKQNLPPDIRQQAVANLKALKLYCGRPDST